MASNVSTPSTAYDRMEARRKLCRDLMGGTDAMRAGTTDYLLKFDSEDQGDYSVRLYDSFLVGFFEEAVLNVVGKVFAKPLTLGDDVPPKIEENVWPNVDLAGCTADVFLYNVGIDSTVNGISFVLVDMPTSSIGTRTVADEAQARPFWTHYKAQDVIEAMVIFEDGLPRLQRLRILAKHEQPQGEWGSVAMDRVLVFERGQTTTTDPGGDVLSFDRSVSGSQRFASFRVFEKHVDSASGKPTETWLELPEESGHFIPPRSAPAEVRDRFVEIPAVAFYTEKTGHFEADPPLRDGLGDLCLQHWRKKSHQDTLMHAVNTPIMTAMMTRADFEGANRPVTSDTNSGNTRQLKMGPYTFLFTGGEGRDIKWLEHGGVSLAAGREDLVALEQQIRQAAADPFIRQSQGTETATAEILAEGQRSTRAQVWAASWQSSINECLKWTGSWLGLESGGTVTFGKGVMESLSSVGDFSHVLDMYSKGELDGEALIQEAKRYGIIGQDTERAEDANKPSRGVVGGGAAAFLEQQEKMKAAAQGKLVPSEESEEPAEEEGAA